ncbi:MAG: hemerythrin domain-containing protein [Tatlockia sp.]|nr:hemerythrin domain-containing protein [Tatlockia sp.]
MRFDLYTTIHKAQREHLYKISMRIAKADFSDSIQASSIKKDVEKMIKHLKKHAENEDNFIHPLFHVCKDKCDLLESQHTTIEALLEELKELINSDNLDQLYPLFNRLIAMYLTHTDLEETLQKEILWNHYSDEELKEVITKFLQSLSLEKTVEDMEFMLPCLSVTEVCKILMSMQNAPMSLLQKVSLIVEKAFSNSDWEQIKLNCFGGDQDIGVFNKVLLE